MWGSIGVWDVSRLCSTDSSLSLIGDISGSLDPISLALTQCDDYNCCLLCFGALLAFYAIIAFPIEQVQEEEEEEVMWHNSRFNIYACSAHLFMQTTVIKLQTRSFQQGST